MDSKLDKSLQRVIDQCEDEKVAEANAKKSASNSDVQKAWLARAQKLRNKKQNK